MISIICFNNLAVKTYVSVVKITDFEHILAKRIGCEIYTVHRAKEFENHSKAEMENELFQD